MILSLIVITLLYARCSAFLRCLSTSLPDWFMPTSNRSVYQTKTILQNERVSVGYCIREEETQNFTLTCSGSPAVLLASISFTFIMHPTFSWAYEAKGSSGFIEYASNPKRPANVAEAVDLSRPSIVPKVSRAGISPGERTSTQLKSYRDVGVSADLRSPSRPKTRPEFGSGGTAPPQAKRWNKTRSMWPENSVDVSGVGGRDRRPYEDDCKNSVSKYIVLYVLICEQSSLTHTGGGPAPTVPGSARINKQ
ncbi:hypothetical protein F5B21DRAFT_399158 [Xylaria acuta]|nr:hypothetical protein F5B21DRAFT_399158 [Xylaria acuta]